MSDDETATVARVTLDLLRDRGVTTIFGNPGSTELGLFRGFPADFRYVLGLQEAVAVAMADGFAQATGHAAVVNLHSAAGLGHAMGSLYTASRNRTPLVVITGQQSRSLLSGEPYLHNENPRAFAEPVVKWSAEPARAEDVPAAVARAYHLATAPPAGPVLVSVPADDWDAPAAPVPWRRSSTALGGDEALLAEAGRALAAAAAPALVVGSEVDRDGAVADVVALAEAHGARVWAAPMSHRCSFPESHPAFAGFLPPRRDGIAGALSGHDVVLVLGAPAFTYHVPGTGPVLLAGTRLFQVTDDPLRAAAAPEGTSVLAGTCPAVRALAAHPRTAPRPAPAPRVRAGRVEPGATIDVAYLMQTLADVRPDGSPVVEEAPSSRPVMCEHLPNEHPRSFYTTASGALGFGLPAAVGLALGRPADRVVAVVGDGSLMYAPQALWSAAQLGVALTVVVVDNGGYATVDGFARRFGIDRPVGTVIEGLDHAGLARAQGVPATRVDAPADLAGALRAALAPGGPRLLHVVVDP